MADTPIARMTINQIQLDDLEKMLTEMRARRLVRVQKLEALARAKADDVMLTTYIQYERAYARAKRLLDKAQAEEQRIDDVLHKVRTLVFKMEV